MVSSSYSMGIGVVSFLMFSIAFRAALAPSEMKCS